MRILQETTSGGGFTFEPAANGQVVNNLFYFEDGDISTHVNIGPNTSPATFDFAHNLWFAWDAPGASTPTLPSAEAGGIYGENPQLTAEWQIPGTSPAAGAGAAQVWLTRRPFGELLRLAAEHRRPRGAVDVLIRDASQGSAADHCAVVPDSKPSTNSSPVLSSNPSEWNSPQADSFPSPRVGAWRAALPPANPTLDAAKSFAVSPWVSAAVLLAVLPLGSARAQPSCPSLPPPAGRDDRGHAGSGR